MMSGDVTLSPHMQTRNSREDDGKFRVMDLVTFQLRNVSFRSIRHQYLSQGGLESPVRNTRSCLDFLCGWHRTLCHHHVQHLTDESHVSLTLCLVDITSSTGTKRPLGHMR